MKGKNGKLYLNDSVIDINLLKDLKRKYNIVFKDSFDVDLELKGNVLTYRRNGESCEVEFSHWVNEKNKLSIAEIIEQIDEGLSESENLFM